MSSDSSSSAAVGIVTSADDQYLYVWSKAVDPGAKELRFSKDSSADIKVGAWVHFDLDGQSSPDGVQTASLQPAAWMEPIAPIVRMNLPGGCVWKASCVVTFCPPNYAPYVQAKASCSSLLGLAYSDLFGHVALLDGKFHYEVGKVYKLRVRRIDRAKNDVAQAVGTLFCVSVGSILDAVVEVRDEEVRNEVLEKAPWPREQPTQEPATSKDTDARCSTYSGATLSNGAYNSDVLKDSKVATDSKLDATPSAGHFYEGIIYDLRPLYILVYVPQFRMSVVALKNEVRPAVGALLQFRLKEADGFIVRLDVPYQAIAVEEVGIATNEQLLEVRKIMKKAQPSDAFPPHFSTLGSVQGPRATVDAEQDGCPGLVYEGVVYELVTARAYIYVSRLGKTVVAFTTDTFQPPPGAVLRFRLKNSLRYFGSQLADAPEVIGAADEERLLDIYKVVYPRQEVPDAQELASSPNRWEPTLSHSRREPAHNPSGWERSGDWDRWEPHDHLLQAVDNEPEVEEPKPTFAHPANWNFTPTDKKATDLLGVAVATAKGTTTFYTRLGTVEIPAEAQIGVWVRMDVTLTDGRFAQGDDDVLRIEQLVPPPMDTRVIRGKRVMLTAEVEKHSDGVGNQFLGAVLDLLSLLPRDAPNRLFVAELEFEKGCFHVVKYHKPSTFGAPVTVPLEESAYPFPEDHRGLDAQQGLKEYAELLQLQHDM